MEPRHVLSAGPHRGGVSAETPDLTRLCERIRAHSPLGGDHPVRRNPRRRGDDDLNPGMIDPAGAFTDAAVLVALVARPDEPHVLLTRRTAHLNAHAGQCAFPGGRIEAWDASPESAALREAEEEVGLDPEIAFRMVEIESSFRRHAVSSAGAVGYTQIKPSTARWLNPNITREKLFDTRTNLRLGFRYLSELLNRYDGDVRLALLAYNRGPTRVGSDLAMGRDPGNGYARSIMAGRPE